MASLYIKILLILCFTLLPVSVKAEESKYSLNNLSKITYTLTQFGIPFKRKDLPAVGEINYKASFIDSSNEKLFLLTGIDFKSHFTSRLPLFRKVIEYDKYPYFSFSTKLNSPVTIKDLEIAEIEGTINFHGVSRKKNIVLNCKIKDNKMYLTGNVKILMSEFGIEPPRIFFIRIDDSIKTRFELITDII